jgi:hypothetical protein
MPGTNSLVRKYIESDRPVFTLTIFAGKSLLRDKEYNNICVDFISFTNQNGILKQFLEMRHANTNDVIDLINQYDPLFEVATPRPEEGMYKYRRIYTYKPNGNTQTITFELTSDAQKQIVDQVVSLVSNPENESIKKTILRYIQMEGPMGESLL